MKTPEENTKYWLDVMEDDNHPHRKKFSKGFTTFEIEAYCRRMISLIEKDIELKEKAA